MEKMRQWIVLTALGVVGILAAGWFLLVSPQHSHASSLRAQAVSEQQSTAGVESQVAQLKQQQKGQLAQQQRLAQIADQIPDNPQLPTLIRELSAAAHKAGVSLVSLAPSQPTAVTATTTAATTSPLAQIPIAIQVTGSYFNIESFFQATRHMNRALLVTGFTLAPGSNGAGNNSTGGGSGAAAAAPDALTAQVQGVVFESPEVTQPAGTTAQAPATPTTTAPASQASAAPSAAPAQ